jgi:glycosyltransferase involved in cell wall biosynthesis
VRILIVSNFFPPNIVGGAELVAHKQARQLSSDGNDVHVISIGESKLSSKSKLLNIHFVRNSPLNFDPWIAKLRSLQCENTFDYILIHNIRGFSNDFIEYLIQFPSSKILFHHDYFLICNNAVLLNKKSDTCQIPNDANCECKSIQDDFYFRVRNDLFRALAASANLNIAPSNYLSKMLSSQLDLPVIFKTNGYPELLKDKQNQSTPQICKHEDSRKKFILSGYLGTHKGAQVALKAVQKLPEDGWCISIIGDGPLRSQFESIAKTNKNIHVYGKLKPDDADKKIQESDCLIFPSIWSENEPLTILQAMKHGKHIIASNHGAMREILHESSATLFKTGDDEVLAECMLHFILNGKRRYTYFSSRLNDSNLDLKKLAEIKNLGTKPLLVACTGQLVEWSQEQLKFFSDVTKGFCFFSYLEKQKNSYQNLEFEILLILGPNYNERALLESLTNRIVILPNNQFFGPEWTAPNIYRYSDALELMTVLGRIEKDSDLSNKKSPKRYNTIISLKEVMSLYKHRKEIDNFEQ